MNFRDFFALVFKLVGLYQLTGLVTMLLGIPSIMVGSGFGLMGYGSMALIIIIAVQVLVIYLFLFKAHQIVGFLKLDKGFDAREINLGSLDSRSLLRASIIIIATYFIVNGLSGSLTQFGNYVNLDPSLVSPEAKRTTLLQTLLSSYSTYNIIVGVALWYLHEKLVNILSPDVSEEN